tara:strand:+ start:147 stop:542 length:396 start_codon:yes stop_codon:yes gene_type:complete
MDNTNQIFAAVSPTSGALMHAGRHSDILDAISTYVRDVSASSPSIATGITWYALTGDIKIEDWDGDMTDDQWEAWEAASPTKIPDYYVEEAVGVLENDKLATFGTGKTRISALAGTPRAPGFKIPEPPADL